MLQYEKFEMAAERAELTSPSGKKYKLTAFDRQPIAFEYDHHGYETVKAIGKSERCVRFFPDEIGIWSVRTEDAHTSDFTVEPAGGGYVELDPRDRHWFVLSDGTPWNAVGINLAFIAPIGKSNGEEFGQNGRAYLGLRKYEYWFRRCSENGINLVRIWLGQEYLCPDTSEAGVLDPIQLEKLDHLLDLAKKYGIRIKLTLEMFRQFDYEYAAESNSYKDDVFRKFHKRFWKNGKRCESIVEWMGERVWRDAWIETMGNLAKRIAGNPAIFGIELWNEMNCCSSKWLCDWNEEMLPAAKALFPKHLVMNSLGSFDSDSQKKSYDDFCWEKTDVKQVHRYLDQGAPYRICHDDPIALIRDAVEKLSEPDKPFFVAETGGVNDCHSGPFRFYSVDDEGIILRDLILAPIFCGASGCGHMWHWDERYIESKNLWKHYSAVARLCDGIDFAAESFTPAYIEDERAILMLLRGKTITLGFLRNRSYSWQRLYRDLEFPETLDYKLPFDREIEVIEGDGTVSGNMINGLGFGMLFRVKEGAYPKRRGTNGNDVSAMRKGSGTEGRTE